MDDSMRPSEISCWIWYDKQKHADLDLWQQCLLAAHNAGAGDTIQTATMMYRTRGGAFRDPRSRRDRRPLKTKPKGAK